MNVFRVYLPILKRSNTYFVFKVLWFRFVGKEEPLDYLVMRAVTVRDLNAIAVTSGHNMLVVFDTCASDFIS